jgi:hypothetical protein
MTSDIGHLQYPISPRRSLGVCCAPSVLDCGSPATRCRRPLLPAHQMGHTPLPCVDFISIVRSSYAAPRHMLCCRHGPAARAHHPTCGQNLGGTAPHSRRRQPLASATSVSLAFFPNHRNRIHRGQHDRVIVTDRMHRSKIYALQAHGDTTALSHRSQQFQGSRHEAPVAAPSRQARGLAPRVFPRRWQPSPAAYRPASSSAMLSSTNWR